MKVGNLTAAPLTQHEPKLSHSCSQDGGRKKQLGPYRPQFFTFPLFYVDSIIKLNRFVKNSIYSKMNQVFMKTKKALAYSQRLKKCPLENLQAVCTPCFACR